MALQLQGLASLLLSQDLLSVSPSKDVRGERKCREVTCGKERVEEDVG
jgi:hypothetical protein